MNVGLKRTWGARAVLPQASKIRYHARKGEKDRAGARMERGFWKTHPKREIAASMRVLA